MSWTTTELAELAICARYGAQKSREDAERATAVSVKHIHLNTAALREEMAQRLEAARARLIREEAASMRRDKPSPPTPGSREWREY